MKKYGQRAILKTRMRIEKKPSLSVAGIISLLKYHGVDVEVSRVFLPVPLITVDGKNHGVTIPEELKFQDEKVSSKQKDEAKQP